MSEQIGFNCTACGVKLKAPERKSGQSLPCPQCGESVRVPALKPATVSWQCPSCLEDFDIVPGCEPAVCSECEAPKQTASDLPGISVLANTSKAEQAIQFPCKNCKRIVETPKDMAGKKWTCPTCGIVNDVITPRMKTAGNVIAVIVVIVFAIFVSSTLRTMSDVAVRDRPQVIPRPSTGESAVLRLDGELVPIAYSQEAFDRMTKLAVAKDQIGWQQLARSGLVAEVPSGTTALVISSGIFNYEVRITSGQLKGESVFVASDFVFAK